MKNDLSCGVQIEVKVILRPAYESAIHIVVVHLINVADVKSNVQNTFFLCAFL